MICNVFHKHPKSHTRSHLLCSAPMFVHPCSSTSFPVDLHWSSFKASTSLLVDSSRVSTSFPLLLPSPSTTWQRIYLNEIETVLLQLSTLNCLPPYSILSQRSSPSLQRWCLGPVLFKEEEGAMVEKKSNWWEKEVHLTRRKFIQWEKVHLMRKSPFH